MRAIFKSYLRHGPANVDEAVWRLQEGAKAARVCEQANTGTVAGQC